MICQFKMDDRLIHGMVYMTWFPHFKINRAVIVDDEIVNNETRKMTLRLGMPQSAKLAIWNVDTAIEKFKAGIDQGSNVMVITQSPVPLLKMKEGGIDIKEICCGNKTRNSPEDKCVIETMWANEEDLAAWKELDKQGVRIYSQFTPQAKSDELNEKLRNL